MNNNEDEAAKTYGRTLHIPEEQLSWSISSLNEYKDLIQASTRINPEKSLEGKTFYDRLKAKNPDFIVVIAYGKILPQSVLDLAHFGAINVHGSLLPKYRGASPLQSIFLEKEEKSEPKANHAKLRGGITIMQMDAGMDTGDIIDTLSFPIPFHRTVAELIQALQQQGPKFLNDTLWNFAKGLITPVKQEESEATYTKKIEKADGFFVLSLDPLKDVYAKYRAFSLRPKVRFVRQDKKVIIEKLTLDEELFEIHKSSPLLDNGKLNPAVKEIFLKPEGKKEMDWKSFVNGYLK
ncbi:MAG: methionyl-tRNA formyltransferase [Candidatus Peribacteria bacterium]|nr:methionyl-tRNA formyltransferase [Candidatus Peribacteria bacterium]